MTEMPQKVKLESRFKSIKLIRVRLEAMASLSLIYLGLNHNMMKNDTSSFVINYGIMYD